MKKSCLRFWLLCAAPVLATASADAQTEASRVCINNWARVMENLPAPGPLPGSATVSFIVTSDSRLEAITVKRSSGPAYAEAALAAVKRLHCDSGGDPVRLEAVLLFKAAP